MSEIDIEKLKSDYLVHHLSSRDIAKKYDIPPTRAYQYLKDAGVLRNKTEAIKISLENIRNTQYVNNEKGLANCTHCNTWKPISEFAKLSKNIIEIRYVCNECHKREGRKWVVNRHKEAIQVISKFYGLDKIKCIVEKCGITNMDILQIHHKFGGGWEDSRESGGRLNIFGDIINGNRDINEFEIRCPNHNYQIEVDNGYGEKKYLSHPDYTSRVAVETITRKRNIQLCCEDCNIFEKLLLTVEHPSGNGIKERSQYYTGGFYRAINRLEIDPKQYEILCRTCQWGRRIYGKDKWKELCKLEGNH